MTARFGDRCLGEMQPDERNGSDLPVDGDGRDAECVEDGVVQRRRIGRARPSTPHATTG
jgi:hypothetical protein